ncbi:hypothetical protein R69608_01414 [Paraburkholderia nemoris]|uniref:hypothetical protein n=1 Tax=Paraburkholderia nemoris TaxID=2793076 RepID=UPI00191232AB|nr:hypothetical protein [Paraburkholderia nemoris]MBK5148038.1 hypothetical protein [Burkholderia sp. R-69608]CAE6876111.1 hypothetical protein R69608_01414 [Paraburkholderia nemoris]
MATFFERMTKYQWYMAVLNMTREQIDADPLAMQTLLEIRNMINDDPDDEICVGLRPRVERLLGPQQWNSGSAS